MGSMVSERALTALALLLAGIGLLVSTFGLQFADLGGAFSPTFFPQIILGIWIGLAVIGLASEIASSKSSPKCKVVRVSVLSVAIVVYGLVMTSAGFLLSSAAFIVLMLVMLGVRSPLIIGIYAVALPGSLVVLFNHILVLPLPTSPFTYWF